MNYCFSGSHWKNYLKKRIRSGSGCMIRNNSLFTVKFLLARQFRQIFTLWRLWLFTMQCENERINSTRLKILFMSSYSLIHLHLKIISNWKYAPSVLYSNFDDGIDYGLWGMYLVAIVMTFFFLRSSHHYLFIFVLYSLELNASSFSCRRIFSCSSFDVV